MSTICMHPFHFCNHCQWSQCLALAFAVWGQWCKWGNMGPAYHYFHVTDARRNHTTNVHTSRLELCNALTLSMRFIWGPSVFAGCKFPIKIVSSFRGGSMGGLGKAGDHNPHPEVCHLPRPPVEPPLNGEPLLIGNLQPMMSECLSLMSKYLTAVKLTS